MCHGDLAPGNGDSVDGREDCQFTSAKFGSMLAMVILLFYMYIEKRLKYDKT